MPWRLHILGTNAAVPMLDRHPSAQALDTSDEIFLIDCGEGTQSRLSEYRIRRSRIHHIFISHLHGDHIFGLPGLITSLNLFGRTDPLYLYGPPGLQNFMEIMLDTTGINLHFSLNIHEHDTAQPKMILKTRSVIVKTLPLDHRIPTAGFLFRERVSLRRINKEALDNYQVPFRVIESLKEGYDWLREDGTIIPNAELTLPGREPISFAYCSDTRYYPSLIPMIRGTQLLYHEATFGQDLAQEATKRGHSTSVEAALLAKSAGVKQLVIGHFSARYRDTSILLSEAKSKFENTVLAKEGLTLEITSE